MILHKADLNFKWKDTNSFHFISIIIESRNDYDESERVLLDIISSTFKMNRYPTVSIGVIEKFALAKEDAISTLRYIYQELNTTNYIDSEKFKKVLLKYNKITIKSKNISFKQIIEHRAMFILASQKRREIDVEQIKQRVFEAKREVSYENQLLTLSKMLVTLKNGINGIVETPKYDSNGNIQLDEFGEVAKLISYIEPRTGEIKAYQELASTIKDFIAIGENKSKLSSSDYLENERKMMDRIKAEKERLLKRAKEFKKNVENGG